MEWSLENIYPGIGSPQFLSDIEELGRLSERIIAAADGDIPALVSLYEKASAIAETLTYADALLSTDTQNEAYMKGAERAQRASASFAKAETAFLRAIGRTDEDMPGYEYAFSNIKEGSRHLMSDAEEALAADLALSGSSAWERLQESLASSAESTETLTALRAKASDRERSVRKKAYEDELALLDTHKVAFAAALSGVKGSVLLLDGRRGWKPLGRSLYESRLSEKALDVLIAAIRRSLPLFRRYFRIKAELLSLEDFSFYDLSAPVGKAGSWSFEEAFRIVRDSFMAFSPEMGKLAEDAYSGRWIDSGIRKGKAGGAYDTYFPKVKESRIFLNFDSSYDSVLTLAHELGHAYHDRVTSSLPPLLSSYPMTLAETASVFAEKLVMSHLLPSASKEEALFIIDSYLSSAAQTIVDIYSRFLFEKNLFEKRSEGPLSPDECSALMLEAQEEAYGDAIKDKHRYMWAVKSHYYSADFSFYNYPYAFGEFFSLFLFSQKDGKGYAERYRDMLSLTGRASAEDTAASLGADILSDAFYDKGLGVIESMIRRLDDLKG